MFIERYNRLHAIAKETIEKLICDGVETLPLLMLLTGGRLLHLGIDKVVALLPETITPHGRDHLIFVYFAAIESYLYRHGYRPTGHIIRIISSNYQAASEEEKQEIIQNGISFQVGAVSSADDLIAFTPLRRITDAKYSDLYEKLTAAWGNPRQKAVATMMEIRLATIHELLPKHKIGDNFRRMRAGREEPLPLYVRNEIHHPTTDGLTESKDFQQDKRIGYAIMDAWLPKED